MAAGRRVTAPEGTPDTQGLRWRGVHYGKTGKPFFRVVRPGLPGFLEPGFGWAEEDMRGYRLPADARPDARLQDYYLNDDEVALAVTMRNVWINGVEHERPDGIDRDTHGMNVIDDVTGEPPGRKGGRVKDQVEIWGLIAESASGQHTLIEMLAGRQRSPEREELARVCGTITAAHQVDVKSLWTVLGCPEGTSMRTIRRWRSDHTIEERDMTLADLRDEIRQDIDAAKAEILNALSGEQPVKTPHLRLVSQPKRAA